MKIILSANEQQKNDQHRFIEDLKGAFDITFFDPTHTYEDEPLILLGGDGSLNFIVNNLKGSAKILYFPTGTANDFSRSLNFNQFDPSLEIVQDILQYSLTVDIPIMECNEKLFINVATGGAPAEVTSDGKNLLKDLTGTFEYYLRAMEQVVSPKSFTISFNGKEKLENQSVYGFAISQGLYAGGGAKVSQSHIPFFKKQFSLLSIKSNHLGKALGDVLELQKEGPKELSEFTQYQVLEELEIFSDEEIPLKLDGEPYETKKAIFKKSGTSLSFFVY